MEGLSLETKIILIYGLTDTMIHPLKWKDENRSKDDTGRHHHLCDDVSFFYQFNYKLKRLVDTKCR